MKTISFKVADDLHAWLEQESKRRGLSKSAIVRASLKDSRGKNTAFSCHNLISDVCGSLRSEVRDLGTNKKYMARFGEWKR